jgi:hypothetical protein
MQSKPSSSVEHGSVEHPQLNMLSWNGIALGPATGFPRLLRLSYSLPNRSGLQQRDPAEGQYAHPAIKIAFWQDEKTCHFRNSCLLPMPQAAFPIE